ncbi:MAG: cell wall hydrolase [Lachnospiraceae bacterium]|jgi:peptidoglycan hydrolase CwlO-like protein|nr:cell wall hydrolase [Lachnospiraceae bacterium]
MISFLKKGKGISVLAFATVLCMLFTYISDAAPSRTELQEKQNNASAEVDSIESRLSELTSEIDSKAKQVDNLSEKIEDTKTKLASAKVGEELQYKKMKERIRYMYEHGNTSMLEMIVTSKSMGEFLANIEYVDNINDYDRESFEKLKKARTNIEKTQEKLNSQKKEITKINQELNEKAETLKSQVASAKLQLSDYTTQLNAIKAAEQKANTANGSKDTTSNSGNTSSKNNNSSNKKPSNSGGGGSNTSNGSSHNVNTSDRILLAAILECEAGGESFEAELAVATVIFNRVESSRYPNTVRGVIFASGQFSPTWNGSLDRVLAKGPTRTAFRAADAAIGGKRDRRVIHCYSFNYAGSGVSGITIGDNTFY